VRALTLRISHETGHRSLAVYCSGQYRTLQREDTVGMFQVESRAQTASLPRNHPKKFYDVLVQVAIIRPGPIVGKMMHP
jgi:DNA polymerase III alpha subunit